MNELNLGPLIIGISYTAFCILIGYVCTKKKLLIEVKEVPSIKYCDNVISNHSLCLAVANGRLDIITNLVDIGADINSNLGELLNLAIDNGHLDIARYLINKSLIKN